MKTKFIYLLMIGLFTLYSNIVNAQEPCEPVCCPDGAEHVFDGSTGVLPPYGSIFQGLKWEAKVGNPYYYNEGCQSPLTSIALNPVNIASPGDVASFSSSGFAGVDLIFEEGKTYCIQLCQKVVGSGNGAVTLFAENTVIGTTVTQIQSDGWQTIQINFTATTDYYEFLIQNNSAGPIDGDPLLLVDDICISEYNPDPPACAADFDFEWNDCDELCLVDESCGNVVSYLWSINGPGYPTGGNSDADNPCFDINVSGIYSVTLTVTCSDGSTHSKTKSINLEYPDTPTITCPDSESIIGNIVGGECQFDYTIPVIPFTNGILNCILDGTTPVLAGNTITLSQGIHTISCYVAGDCGQYAECSYTITVECENMQDILCGKAIMTAFSGINTSPSGSSIQDLNGPVVGIVDNRDWATAPSGSNWTVASSGIYSHVDWDAAHLGEVFGLATDNSNNIYVASSSIYGIHPAGPAGDAGIYKVNAVTGNITNLVNTGPFVLNTNNIPNTGSGIGNICYATINSGYLYASNFFDGLIYQIDANTGNVVDRFDPFSAPIPNQLFSPLGQRPWAVAYNSLENKLYFSNWDGYTFDLATNLSIYSIDLDVNGHFVGVPNLELTISDFIDVNGNSPISDIAFSFDGKMLIGHRTMFEDYNLAPGYWAHRSVVLEYEKSLGTWQLTPGHNTPTNISSSLKFKVGKNSKDGAGGVAYGYESFETPNPSLCATSIWATSDALSPTHGGGVEPWIYGLAGMSSSGGASNLDVIIDWNNDVTVHDKSQIGDVEIFNCGCETTEVICDSLSISFDTISIQGQGGCCYQFDITNNWGAEIIGLEAEIQGNDWIFSNVFAHNPFTLGTSLLNDEFCMLESSGGSVPLGTTSGAFDACFTQVGTPTSQPVVIFKWKQLFNGSDTLAICSDTLTFENCPIVDTSCIEIINKEITCSDEENPLEYEFCFQVVNNSGGPIGQVTVEDLPLGYYFAYPLTNSKIINIATVPDGGTSSTICITIVSTIPILNPTQICMKFGTVSEDGLSCCHSPNEVCVDLNPCCDPCEDNGVVITNISEGEFDCCYSVGLINGCTIPYFTKFEAEVIGGPVFGSHVINPIESGNWTIASTPTNICMTPISGSINQSSIPDLLSFCLDEITASTVNPHIIFKWYALDPVTGENVVVCTDEIITDCGPTINDCLLVTDEVLVCVPDSNKYRLTFTITNTSNPGFTADRLHLLIKNDPNYVPVPTGTIIPLTPALGPGQSRTITTCIQGTPFPFPHSNFVFGYRLQDAISGDCCFESRCDTIPTPSCDPLCCEDFDAFCDLVDLGFQISKDSCVVTVSAPQFDSCHWFGTSGPDWGDGTISFPVLTPAVGAGPWTHVYNQNGTYNICITVFEGNDEDNLCWNKQMCTVIEIDCKDECPIDCDLVDIDIQADPDDECCFIGSIDNNLCENFAKGILLETDGNATISQVLTLNGWYINQISATEAELYPPVDILIGHTDIFRVCNENNSGPFTITVSWLIDDGNGGCITECEEEITLECDGPPPNQCIQVLSDTINCTVKEYCFTVKNVTNPGFDINSIVIHDLTPIGSLTPTVITIPTLTPGSTTEVCINYQNVNVNDNICFKITGHDVDLNTEPYPTQCCVDTVEHCFIVPLCPPYDPPCCDISDADFNLLLDSVQVSSNAGLCQACVDYDLDDCTQLTLDFENGSTYIVNGQGTQCQLYPVNYSGTVVATIVRYDENGDICKTASKIVNFDSSCDDTDCCDAEVNDLLDAIDDVWGNRAVDSCSLCMPFEIDTCVYYDVDFGDGMVLTGNGNNVLCHAYSTSGTYTITIKMFVHDANGDICVQAERIFDMDISDCVGPPLCDPSTIVVYNAISPNNGDAINDELIIEGYADCGKIDISIYNRWGQLVWKQADYDNTWKGTSLKGKDLPDGTYYLILALPDQKDDSFNIHTFIDLRRDN